MKEYVKGIITGLLTVSAALLLAGVPAFAANGDIVCPVYTTDIITKIDGREIQGYSLNGRMMIALEDLVPYGYSVSWDGDTSTLIVLKTGHADAFFDPSFGRGKAGEIAGYMYESDITVFLNGKRVEAYSIGGKMVVCAEDISDGNINPNTFLDDIEYQQADYYTKQERSHLVSDYWMTHWWDAENRVLYLYNTSEGFVDPGEQAAFYSLDTQSSEFTGENPVSPYTIKPLLTTGLSSATVYNTYFGADAHAGWWNSLKRVNADGTVFDYTDICIHYGIYDERTTSLTEWLMKYAPVVSPIDGQPDYIRRITGKYKTGVINLNTMTITDIQDIAAE